RFIIFLVALVTLAACSSPVRDEIDLMPAPDVYGGGMLDPLPEKDPEIELPYKTLLYATDREPGSPSDSQEYYLNERGQIMRLGVARISLHQPDLPW
ncbi:MAG: hypothetical protein WBO47_03695, partial [Gammaproteobacteria bacterium]